MMFTAIIYGICAIIMFTIGIFQYRSKAPVTFYTGEKPYKPEELTDVKAWNRRHGIMWMIYGVIIIISWVIGYLIGESILAVIPFIFGLIPPIFGMVWYHEHLVKKYKKQ